MNICLTNSITEHDLLLKEVKSNEIVIEYKLGDGSTTLTIPRWCFSISTDRKILSLYAEDIDGEVNSYVLNLDEALKMFISSSEAGEGVEYRVGLPIGENVTRMTWYNDILSIVNSFGPAELSIIYGDKKIWVEDNEPVLEIIFKGHDSPLYISMLLLDGYYNNPDREMHKWLVNRNGNHITKKKISSDMYDLIESYHMLVSRLGGGGYYTIYDIKPEKDNLFFEYFNKWTIA